MAMQCVTKVYYAYSTIVLFLLSFLLIYFIRVWTAIDFVILLIDLVRDDNVRFGELTKSS